MARTYRKYPSNYSDLSEEEYKDKVRRGLVPVPKRDPDDNWEEVSSQKNKKRAKKRTSRKRRLNSQQYIDEHLDELNL